MKKMAIVLAAGQGKRMKSKLYKVLHQVGGKPMVGHVLEAVQAAQCERTVVIVGHGAEAVQQFVGDRALFALQEQQLGTGHAVAQAEQLLGGEEGTTVVVCGDTPLITAETIEALIALHQERGAAASVLSATASDPQGFGRIIRNTAGELEGIVEQKDCTVEQTAITEINTGTYCFDNRKLFAALKLVTNNNAQGEYYLTDVISILKEQGNQVLAYCTDDFAEGIGVNDRVALAEAERLLKERIVRKHQLAGVTIIDPAATYISADAEIGSDTVIWPGSIISGRTRIGEGCKIGPHAQLKDAELEDGVEVNSSTIDGSVIGAETAVGPYAYIRPGSRVGKGCKVGDFVELKNAVLGDGTKVSHLSYVGDAKVGADVNIGCGAITVNYDGINKSLTEIGDGAFIGSNVNLIAPVTVGDGAYVVAGSTITHHVPAGDVAIARERQVNKAGYAEKIRNRAAAKKKAAKEQ